MVWVEYGEWVLVHETTHIPMRVNERVKTFRGDEVIVTGGAPPHKPDSTGKIYVRIDADDTAHEYYPSVCGLVWIKCK